MRRGSWRILCSAAAVFVLASAAEAGPWTQQAGHGYYRLGLRSQSAHDFFEFERVKVHVPTYTDNTFSLYGERGLTDRWTGIAYVPFWRRITLNEVRYRQSRERIFEGDDVTHISDAEVGVRFRLARGASWSSAASFFQGLPIGQDEQRNGLLTGDGEWNQSLRLAVGKSVGGGAGALSAEGALNNRHDGFSDEFLYELKAEHRLPRRFGASVRFFGQETLRNGHDPLVGRLTGTSGLYANDQVTMRLAPGLSWQAPSGLGLSVSHEWLLRGENVMDADAWDFGLFFAN